MLVLNQYTPSLLASLLVRYQLFSVTASTSALYDCIAALSAKDIKDAPESNGLRVTMFGGGDRPSYATEISSFYEYL
jgi:hypothetical protein